MTVLRLSPTRRSSGRRKNVPKKTASVFGSLVIVSGALSFTLLENVNSGLPEGAPGAEITRSIPVTLQAAHSVSIKNLQFDPSALNIAVGDTVTWTNNETDGTVHNVTSDDNSSFVSPDLAPSATYSYTATSPGTFSYHCRFHPQTIGTLNVSGSGAPPPPGQPPPPPPPSPPPPPPDDPGGGGGGLIPGLPGLPPLPLPIAVPAPAPAGSPAAWSAPARGSSVPGGPAPGGPAPGSPRTLPAWPGPLGVPVPRSPLAPFNELMSQIVQQLGAVLGR